MLILSLKIGERIVVGDNVVIEVEETYKIREIKYVKLDVTAPKEIPVYRNELLQKINDNKS